MSISLLKRRGFTLGVLLCVLNFCDSIATAGPVSFPLTINSVTAVRNRDLSVSVNWVIEREIGTRQYVLERSTDGVSFVTIDVVTTTSNEGSRAEYDRIDWNALRTTAYYRIKAISLTGKLSFSGIVKVEVAATATPVTVFPNPVAGKLMHVHISNQKGTYSLALYNKLGQQVWSSEVTADISNDVRSFPVGRIASGTYNLVITGSDRPKTVQQIIIN